uniref:Uncharacterized protein n=1 Tax=Arundo donax TaxID=35708 RepID=A0A0A9AL48_ARUDO
MDWWGIYRLGAGWVIFWATHCSNVGKLTWLTTSSSCTFLLILLLSATSLS